MTQVYCLAALLAIIFILVLGYRRSKERELMNFEIFPKDGKWSFRVTLKGKTIGWCNKGYGNRSSVRRRIIKIANKANNGKFQIENIYMKEFNGQTMIIFKNRKSIYFFLDNCQEYSIN